MAARDTEVEHMISAKENSEDCLLLTESVERDVQPMVVVLSWHRAYGEALLYAQSDRAATLISKAEQRIFERYLELAASSFSLAPEEGRDLWDAIMTLSGVWVFPEVLVCLDCGMARNRWFPLGCNAFGCPVCSHEFSPGFLFGKPRRGRNSSRGSSKTADTIAPQVRFLITRPANFRRVTFIN